MNTCNVSGAFKLKSGVKIEAIRAILDSIKLERDVCDFGRRGEVTFDFHVKGLFARGDPQIQALADALGPLVAEPGVLKFVDVGVTPLVEGNQVNYYVGDSKESRLQAQIDYAVSQLMVWLPDELRLPGIRADLLKRAGLLEESPAVHRTELPKFRVIWLYMGNHEQKTPFQLVSRWDACNGPVVDGHLLAKMKQVGVCTGIRFKYPEDDGVPNWGESPEKAIAMISGMGFNCLNRMMFDWEACGGSFDDRAPSIWLTMKVPESFF
jgi:hypothetical protein